jgi:trk system potassium uptake protein TrkA
MRVVILGCGRVGSALAHLMSRAGHEVTIIDMESSAFRRLPSDFKGQTMRGMGLDVDVLKDAGIERADAFVAATQGDNRNIMAAQIAKTKFGVPKVVARIYDPIRARAYRELGIQTICSTALGAGIIHDLLEGKPFRTIEEYEELAKEFGAQQFIPRNSRDKPCSS